MSSKVALMGSLFLAGVLALTGGAARADSTTITSHGAICHNYNAWEVQDIDYVLGGVHNLASSSRKVICPAPRSPTGVPTSKFIVSGNNYDGTSTPCTVYAFDGEGSLKTTQSFVLSGWKSVGIADLGSLSPTDFVMVLCTLPPNGDGLIRGIYADW